MHDIIVIPDHGQPHKSHYSWTEKEAGNEQHATTAPTWVQVLLSGGSGVQLPFAHADAAPAAAAA